MALRYRLVVKRPLEVVAAVVSTFGESAQMSLEGDLSALRFDRFEGLTRDPTDVLRSNTLEPRLMFAIVPLTADNRDLLLRSELPRVGLRRRIVHLQIADSGVVRFAACDNFHPDCVWADACVPEEVLRRLQAQGSLGTLMRT
jgi:hypothetical protein